MILVPSAQNLALNYQCQMFTQAKLAGSLNNIQPIVYAHIISNELFKMKRLIIIYNYRQTQMN